MTAREYLQEIKNLDTKINQRQFEYDSLKKHIVYIASFNDSAYRVRTSPEKEGFTKVMGRLYNLQNEINAQIDRFHDIRHERIDQIQLLPRDMHSDILFKRYVQYQNFEEISVTLGYVYHYICTAHEETLNIRS